MRRGRPENRVGGWLRLAAGLSGGMAGALFGSDGWFVFNETALLFTCAGAILALLVLRVALRLPSPFQRL